MDSLIPAFALHPTTAVRPRASRPACSCVRSSVSFSTFTGRTLRTAVPAHSHLLRMQTEPEPTPPEEEGITSATEILKTLRAVSEADTSVSERSMLGIYRDVDGKSNVWAVEPTEQTDTGPQLSKTTIIIAAAAFIVIALLVLPLLPFTNPDQL